MQLKDSCMMHYITQMNTAAHKKRCMELQRSIILAFSAEGLFSRITSVFHSADIQTSSSLLVEGVFMRQDQGCKNISDLIRIIVCQCIVCSLPAV